MPSLDPAAAWILRAVLALGLWTFVMSNWMGLVRLPAMKKAGLSLQDAAHTNDLLPVLPSSARRVSDNYNHLLEAPTVFYAAALAIVASGRAEPVDAMLAWSFVGLRVLHSLVQATVNRVTLRLVFYLASWYALAALMVLPLLRLA